LDALTASEHRIASVAAAGMSNRDIAQALLVTVNTVDTHLGPIYYKLNPTGRTQLAAALADGGTTSDETVLDARVADPARAHA
jgi:DNA-binding NarL/FixJ family response regulator